MTEKSPQKAVIYCRVSTKKQERDGNGLGSQETTCREYADRKGYEIINVFRDDLTGKTANRSGLKDLLAFLKARKGRTVVIIDDLNRLARSVRTHYAIRDAVAKAGGKLESPKRAFADDPDDDILEIIEAAFAGEHRRKNAEQTLSRMRTRMLNGYWVFHAPYGYRYAKAAGGGSILVPDKPAATIMREALEGFASGRLASQAEVRRFIQNHPRFSAGRPCHLTNEQAMRFLINPLYAGYLDSASWDVSFRKAQHEPLISLETFQRIQDVLKGDARTPNRADLNAEFPLRGHVGCSCCGHPMTATFSRGRRGGLFPYYLCRQRGCARNGKSIRRAQIEEAFADLLRGLTPRAELVKLVSVMFRKVWDDRMRTVKEQATSLKSEAAAIDRQIAQLLDRIVATDNLTVIGAYERKVSELERQKLLLAEKTARCGTALPDYDETLQTPLRFLANPLELWEKGDLTDKRIVLNLAFSDRLIFDPETGFQTPQISLPFKALEDISGTKEVMAEAVGFEPTIQLPVCQFSRLEPSTTRPRFHTDSGADSLRSAYGAISPLPRTATNPL